MWQWRNDNPYGNNLAQGTIEFNLRFAGQYFDAESGFHYNIHRTYNPEIGRYMQSDPMGLSAGSNTYNYVGRNPFDAVDPLGLKGQGIVLSNVDYMIEASNNDDIPDNTIAVYNHTIETTSNIFPSVDLTSPGMKELFNIDRNLWRKVANEGEFIKPDTRLVNALIYAEIIKKLSNNSYKTIKMNVCEFTKIKEFDNFKSSMNKSIIASGNYVFTGNLGNGNVTLGTVEMNTRMKELVKLMELDTNHTNGIANTSKVIKDESFKAGMKDFKIYN